MCANIFICTILDGKTNFCSVSLLKLKAVREFTDIIITIYPKVNLFITVNE